MGASPRITTGRNVRFETQSLKFPRGATESEQGYPSAKNS